jgi:hypothetical protein
MGWNLYSLKRRLYFAAGFSSKKGALEILEFTP